MTDIILTLAARMDDYNNHIKTTTWSLPTIDWDSKYLIELDEVDEFWDGTLKSAIITDNKLDQSF